MLQGYIYDGLRSPFGRHGGVLAGIRADDLAAKVVSALVGRSDLPAERIEDVILGNVCQSGEDSRNVARFVGLLGGVRMEAGGLTVNRLCGSGMAAALDAARSITVGEADLYVAGGVESMTRAPFVLAKSPAAWSRQPEIYDTTIGTRFPNGAFAETFGDYTMPQTADNLAKDYAIGRDECDAFAYAPAACRSTVMLHEVEKPSSRLDPLLKKKKRRPRVLEDGACLTEMTDEAGDRRSTTPASEGSGGEIEKLLGLAFHVEANILMRLVARNPRDALYEVENRFWRPAFLNQHLIDDLCRLGLGEAALAQETLAIVVVPSDDPLPRRLDAVDERHGRGIGELDQGRLGFQGKTRGRIL